jgi:hypothetical protein
MLCLLASGFHLWSQQAATNAPVGLTAFRPQTDSAWSSIIAAKSHKPLASISITNRLPQDEILGMSDPVSVRNGLTNYIDGMCGFGARLGRDYMGYGSLVSVSFLWDTFPKVTRFSFFGSDRAAAYPWQTAMVSVLEKRLGPDAVRLGSHPAAQHTKASHKAQRQIEHRRLMESFTSSSRLSLPTSHPAHSHRLSLSILTTRGRRSRMRC